MSWLKNLDPANASKSFTGILKNIEARLDAVLDIPNSSSEPKLADSNTIHLDVPWVAPSDALEDSGGTETLIASRPVNAPEIGPQNASVLAHGPENVPQDVPASENASSSATAKDTEITAVTAAATTTDTTVIKEADTTVVKEAETTVVKEADTTVVKEAETTVVKEAETTVAEEINGDAREKNVQKLHKEIKKLQDLVQELRKEGEELSKKEGLGRETIRKLKSKELESARNLKELNRNIQERDGEIQDLIKTRDKLLDLEKKQTDSIRNLNDYNQEISKKLKLAQGEIETVQKELLNLQKEQSLGNSEQNKDHEKLIQEFKEFQKTSLEKEEELKQELYEIRKTLDNKIKENGWKEDQHQKEIANLNLRLQASESRMEDLSSIAQEASKPLLRQIESLQTQYNSSLKDWESLERSMANRVKDAELSRSQSVENARILKEENQQLLIQLNNAENLASHLKNDKSRLEFELNVICLMLIK
jgi:DNA repair exonuclease SbcCD ATPase subunit